MVTSPSSRTALLAGATGLIGGALLPLLRASPHCAQVHVLVRRPVPALSEDARTHVHIVDFAQLPALPPLDDAYIALGSTIKQAGSEAAFRRVDFDHVVATATAARAAGATRLAVVSSMGAKAESRVFYNRVKGEMEDAIATLGFASVVIVRPSLLLGDREALGQPKRPGELWATRVFGPILGIVPRSVRPIAATTVAGAMIAAMLAGTPGVRVLGSAQMQA